MEIENLRERLGKIRNKSEDADGYMTAYEIAKEQGLHKETILKWLRAGCEAGIIEVKTVHRTNIAGRTTTIPAYKIIDQA